jgi:hypothetical protein
MLVCLAGCSETDVPGDNQSPEAGPVALATAFDANTTGTIRGRVVWQGNLPQVADFQVGPNQAFFPGWPEPQPPKSFANPNAPVVGPGNGVGNAVVFLRQVDPQQSRPWDHGAVTVAVQDYHFQVVQGQVIGSSGFVRRGEAVTFVSREERFHGVRGRGTEFFSLLLPKPDQPGTRTLTRPGLVELTSAAEYYWLRAYLFVGEHPYYAHTDAHGYFTLAQVPAGGYEVVAWMPNWLEAGHDRNPDMMYYSRLFFRPPVEQVQSAHVRPSQDTKADFAFSTEMFAK